MPAIIKAGSKALIGYDIFISYARADARSYAEALNQHLEDLDYSCFLDRNDLSAGQPLAPALKRAIKRSKMFVLLGSKCALESRYVSDEISAFLEGKIAKWWMPDDVIFVDALSYGATGKIQKMELRRRYATHYSSRMTA